MKTIAEMTLTIHGEATRLVLKEVNETSYQVFVVDGILPNGQDMVICDDAEDAAEAFAQVAREMMSIVVEEVF